MYQTCDLLVLSSSSYVCYSNNQKKLFRMMMAQADLQDAIRSCMGSNRSGSFYWDIACLYRDFASTSLATHIKYQSIIQLDWLGRSCYEIYPKYRWTILESNYYPHDRKILSQHCAIYSKLLKYPELYLSHLAHQINVIIVQESLLDTPSHCY